MWLVNLPQIRVEKYEKGFVVEIQKTTWYGRKYWTHLESTSGLKQQPWFYRDLETAIKEATMHFNWDLRIGTRDFSQNAL